jgi:hypothetical protein
VTASTTPESAESAESAVEVALQHVEARGQLLDPVGEEERGLRVTQERPDPGDTPEGSVDRLDRLGDPVQPVGKIGIDRARHTERAQRTVELPDQRRGIGHRARRAPADHADDPTHEVKFY